MKPETERTAFTHRRFPFSVPFMFMMVGLSFVVGLAVGLSHAVTVKDGRAGINHPESRIRSAVETSGSNTVDMPADAYRTAVAVLKRRYYGAVIDSARTQDLTNEAVKGMLASLDDQFSSYLDPQEWKDLVTMTEGRFGGIGAMLQQSSGSISVTHPSQGGPADRAGLRAGDVLIMIDNHDVKGKSLDDLAPWLEGVPQTTVTLVVLRAGRRMEIPIVREYVQPTIVEHWMEDAGGKIGHIVLTEFNKTSAAQIGAAYSDLEKMGMRALVLDLRFNPGGLLDAAVDVAGMFIPDNANPQLKNVAVIIHHGDGEEEGLALQPLGVVRCKVPLAVLVNGSSASAAEIVTGAIRDYGAGVIVGERTFGKGKVQTLFEMNHGRDGGIRLTTSLYFPPRRYDINYQHDEDGNRVPGTGGIVPDIVVPPSPNWHDDFEDKANDNQLKVAVGYLKARLAGRTAGEATRIALKQ